MKASDIARVVGAETYNRGLGYANDGLKIYGRYLSTIAPGYSIALDVCGGHAHDEYAWHYHTQIINATCE